MTPELSERPAERPAKRCLSFHDTPGLTRALREGNEEAFRWLHSQWNQRLFRYCFVLARGDGGTASEISQATYLRLFRGVRELPDELALWNWIARAARSAAIDMQRTGGRYRAALVRFSDWCRDVVTGSNVSPTGDEAEAVLFAALERVLERLEPGERRVVEGRYFEGLSLEQIAGEIDASTRAVEGRLARLRKKLRRLITEELELCKMES
ncbi:MAG: sigma-70 family RNA polymerase sigma factor [Verrucomicrobia bacterium]|nr:sigma-70 family RNA polymerase sigma factor [Verrucomicrobiota bacterium]